MAEMMEYKHEDFDARYGSKAAAQTGLGLGIAGTALGLLNGGLGLATGMGGCGRNGWGGWNNGYNNGYNGQVFHESVCCDRPVGKETFELQQRVSRLESEKALLASEQNTEVKLADVYERVAKQALDLERKENQRWTEQLVWNAHQDSRIAVLESRVHELMSMTGRYVEASRVTPLPMGRYNSWVAPVDAAAAAQAGA